MTKHPGTLTATTSTTINFRTELDSYEADCRLDRDLQTFDATLQARTNQVITSLAAGVEVKALSFDSLKEVTESLLEMNQEVVKVILECKQDIWNTPELFELVEEYFENSLKTLDFCTALERCLNRARDSQLLILVALQVFDEESGLEGGKGYVKTLEELKKFKAAGDPFTDEFIKIFQDVFSHQTSMLDKLQTKRKKLDKKLKTTQAWRRISGIIFATTVAAVIICSVVAAAIAAPPVAAALAAAVPLGSMGTWIDSLWKKYEDAVKGQKDVVLSMEIGTRIVIMDLDNIRVVIDRLEIQIDSLFGNVDFVIEEKAVKIGIEEIKKKVEVFKKNVEDLGVHTDKCIRDVQRARTVVLQRLIKLPNP